MSRRRFSRPHSAARLSTTAGKALFWNYMGADSKLKVIAFEGEFALTSGHSQELKTAVPVSAKRLRARWAKVPRSPAPAGA